MNYYNEFDPVAAAWLRDLIAAGHIPAGVIDTRSIEDVYPSDLHGFTQCHFFAGIGGWSLALRLAAWPADRNVWTGSCPCQPFSAAGAGAGFADQRHLWPAFFHLIAQCRPAAIFGEQVAGAAVGPWLDLVHADLEAVGYAFGSCAFPAAGVGAPHIRDRTYWVAHSDGSAGKQGSQDVRGRPGGSDAQPRARLGCGGMPIGLADASGERRIGRQGFQARGIADWSDAGWQQGNDGFICGDEAGYARISAAGPVNGHWRVADWLGCRDGKWRPVEPGTFPLAHGLPARVGRLRGYGNAIVPQAAAEFIRAAEEGRLMEVA